MNKFNIGDRVRNLVESDYVKLGAIGSVTENSLCPYVKWDSDQKVAQNQFKLELILPARLRIGDTVMTPDGIGTVEYIRAGAFKYPDKLGVDVKITDTDEINGYGVDDLSLPESSKCDKEFINSKPSIAEKAFKVASVSVTYSVAYGSRVTIESIANFPNKFEIITKGAVFANQAELDAILADFKRRAL
jgi:hypothetical protein